MAYTSLTPGQVDANSPIDQALMDLIRTNFDDLDGRASIQIVNTQVSASSNGTTKIPFDNTIPQKTEGDEYMTLAITPNSATSRLVVEVIMNFGMGSSDRVAMALFKDSDADAINVVCDNHTGASGNGQLRQLIMRHYIASTGSTATRTFKVRAGGVVGSGGTFYFNSENGSDVFSTALASSMTITEIPS